MLQDERGAATDVWAMAHLGTPMAIRVAATLRLADHIHAGHRTPQLLAEAAGADPDALRRLMRYLTVRGLFTCDETGAYATTALGAVLCEDHPAGLRAGLDIEGVGRAELSYVQLLHSVRTGAAAFERQFGHSFWEDLDADPSLRESFDSFMGGDIPARSVELLDAYPWERLAHVVDVGGGDGSLLAALLRRFPALRGTVVDLPAAAATARSALASAGLAARGAVVEGSFFDPLPPGAGAYLLSWILHDWGDEPAHRILRRCAEAAGAGGRVLVVEKTGPDGSTPRTGLDLRMLAYFGGKERDMAELRALCAGAGLGLVAVHAAGRLSIVELTVGEDRP